MFINLAQVISTLSICCAILFIMKLASPYIMSFISTHILGIDNKKKNIDFDILVEQKKSMMRGGASEVAPQVNARKTQRSAFEERINESFAKLSSKANKSKRENSELEEIKKIMELFDKLQWGTGDHLAPLTNQIKKILGYTVTSHQVHKALKAALKSNLLQKIPVAKPISFLEMAQVLSPSIYLDLFLTDQKFRIKQFKATSMTTKHAAQTLHFLCHKNKLKNESKAFELVFKQNKSIVSEAEKKSLIIDQNKIIRIEVLKSDIERYLQVFLMSTAIKKLESKNDVESSLSVFNFKKLPSEKILKDQYKYLVKTRHPDKAESYKLPEAIKKQIHENFATIQQAYDILKRGNKG